MNIITSFKKGIRDGIPVGLAYLSVSFAFGIFAIANGLTVLEATLLSMLNLTSAGEMAAVPIIACGTMPELVISQLVINLRYALMSASLTQRFSDDVTTPHRFLIAFGNTDEMFGIAYAQPGKLGRKYLYGLILPMYVGWSLGTFLGALAGDILPAVVTSALGLGLYAMFITIVLPVAKDDSATALCVLLALALRCGFYYLPFLQIVPDSIAVILSAVTASALFAWREWLRHRKEVGE